MSGINIDETNRIVINPFGYDLDKFKVAKAETEAPNPKYFTCKEPEFFIPDSDKKFDGEVDSLDNKWCFGDSLAEHALRHLLETREAEISAEKTTEEVQEAPVVEDNFVPTESPINMGPEPAFC